MYTSLADVRSEVAGTCWKPRKWGLLGPRGHPRDREALAFNSPSSDVLREPQANGVPGIGRPVSKQALGSMAQKHFESGQKFWIEFNRLL